MKLLCRLVFVFICFLTHDAQAQNPSLSQKLTDLQVLYDQKLQEAVSAFDQDTMWPSATDCDGTLWAGIALAGGVPVQLHLAEHSSGEIHRRPYIPCWNPEEGDVGSKSTVSNDMMLGYLLGLWADKDYPAVKRLAMYGETHLWVMGQPMEEAGAVVLKPNQVGLLGRMLHALSNGQDSLRVYKTLKLAYSSTEAESYQTHLQAISIILNLQVLPYVDPLTQILIEPLPSFNYWVNQLVARNPLNPLCHLAAYYIHGDPEPVIDLLIDPQTPIPAYVRGDRADNYWRGEWLFIAKQILDAEL